MSKKSWSIICSCIIILIIVVSLGIYNKPNTLDHSAKDMTAYLAKETPVIDGIISPDEWNDTELYSYYWSEDEQNITTGPFQIDIALKHNSTKLFILIITNEKEVSISPTLHFDNRNDGFWNRSEDIHMRLYPHYNAYEIGPYQPGFPTPNPAEPVNGSYDPTIGHITEVALNLTHFILDIDNSIGMGFWIEEGGKIEISVPQDALAPETFPNLIFYEESFNG